MEKDFGVFIYEPIDKSQDIKNFIVWNDTTLHEPFILDIQEFKKYPQLINSLVKEKQKLYFIQGHDSHKALLKFESYQIFFKENFSLNSLNNKIKIK